MLRWTMGCFLAQRGEPCDHGRLSNTANLWTRMVGSIYSSRAQQPLFAQASPNFLALVLPLGGRTAFRFVYVTPVDTITFPGPALVWRFTSEASPISPRFLDGHVLTRVTVIPAVFDEALDFLCTASGSNTLCWFCTMISSCGARRSQFTSRGIPK